MIFCCCSTKLYIARCTNTISATQNVFSLSQTWRTSSLIYSEDDFPLYQPHSHDDNSEYETLGITRHIICDWSFTPVQFEFDLPASNFFNSFFASFSGRLVYTGANTPDALVIRYQIGLNDSDFLPISNEEIIACLEVAKLGYTV